ncbi:sigma E protease regulator RseP [Alteromonas facilis]|uniref:sigma E protease regulator RseP n=1 Tax=Alteromonas facilis TaxID=2048004 RepID=UPI000C28602B|nr:sigma E protease regulator RseP [Alteromonas facilis]
MIDFLWNLGSFIVALGILVAVHEWGHFWVARRCGVHVIRFSIGFGKPLWRTVDKAGTEYVVAAIPLGGYVRMLDERVDKVEPEFASKTFNTKSVGQRMAIIAAGPGVNFIFAVFALFCMYLIGVQTVKPLLGEIPTDSYAYQGGLKANDEILRIGDRETVDWSAVNLELMRYIGESRLPLTVKRENGVTQQLTLPIDDWYFDPETQSAWRSLGLIPYRPDVTLEVASVGEDSPAFYAGLQVGDRLKSLGTEDISSWQQAVDIITQNPGQSLSVRVERGGREEILVVTLDSVESEQGLRGYFGMAPRVEPWPEGIVFIHQYGVFEAIGGAVDGMWRYTTISLEMLAKLFTGDVSVKNLSGPISIAQGAGISAEYGIVEFLRFLAIISVSLGIINLLPIPLLDGGHLLYLFVEWITGKPVPESVQEMGFKVGGLLLLTLMGVAIFNDIARLA